MPNDPEAPAAAPDAPAPAPLPPAPETPEEPPKTISVQEHRKVQRENQNLRHRLRETEGKLGETEAKLTEALAAQDPETLRAATHRAVVAELVSEVGALYSRPARLLLLEATTINDAGRLVLADDADGEEVNVEAARAFLPPELLRSAGAPGSGGGTPVLAKTPTGNPRDARMLTSQAAYDRMSPEQRREAEERLRGGPK